MKEQNTLDPYCGWNSCTIFALYDMWVRVIAVELNIRVKRTRENIRSAETTDIKVERSLGDPGRITSTSVNVWEDGQWDKKRTRR